MIVTPPITDARAILLWAQAEIEGIQVRLDKLKGMVSDAAELMEDKCSPLSLESASTTPSSMLSP